MTAPHTPRLAYVSGEAHVELARDRPARPRGQTPAGSADDVARRATAGVCPRRGRMTRRQVLALLVLGSIWGSSFMFIKVSDRDLDPATLVFVRALLAALTLACIVPLRHRPREAV